MSAFTYTMKGAEVVGSLRAKKNFSWVIMKALLVLSLFVIQLSKSYKVASVSDHIFRRYRRSLSTISSVSSGTSSAVADEIDGWHQSFIPTFLEKYWQKRPLLVRNAFPTLIQDIDLTEEDFFALAQDEDVETRLFQYHRGKWLKEYGPFDGSRFNSLRSRNWTILVQEVDRHMPQIADLWQRGFTFIPNWRRDDVMISYSMPGGGIGAHVDNYDVFLLHGG